MPKAKLFEKKKAIELRGKGHSIKFICNKLKVSKGSVSVWVRDVKLTEAQKVALSVNRSISQYESVRKANKIHSENAKKRRRAAEETGTNLIGKISKRDLLIFGVALYWGEGSKTRGDLTIANCDLDLIKVAIKWFDALDIPPKNLRFKLQIPDTFDNKECLEYWSSKLSILDSRIKLYKTKTKGLRIREGYFGTMTVGISSRKDHDKVMAMIRAVSSAQ